MVPLHPRTTKVWASACIEILSCFVESTMSPLRVVWVGASSSLHEPASLSESKSLSAPTILEAGATRKTRT